jgi:hypothetical protein
MENKQTKVQYTSLASKSLAMCKIHLNLDKQNGNTKCHDAIQEEFNSLLYYSTFEDKGKLNTKLAKKYVFILSFL